MADSAALMSISDPVHFVLIRSEPTGENHIVSSHYFEWRPVLAAPFSKCSMSIELTGIGAKPFSVEHVGFVQTSLMDVFVGSESKVPVGVLEVKLELTPKLADVVHEDVVKAQCALEKNKLAERERYNCLLNNFTNSLFNFFVHQDYQSHFVSDCFWFMPSNGGKNIFKYDLLIVKDSSKFSLRYHISLISVHTFK